MITNEDLASINENERNLIINWMNLFIQNTKDNNNLSDTFRKCFNAHYDSINMDSILEPYKGKIIEFIAFIEKEWGWKVEYDSETGILLADENKEHCVCPLVKYKVFEGSELCNCSVGFTAKMFSSIFMKDVKAEVFRSYIRDKKSCIYKIYSK
jgi:hypothetical protein